MSAENEIPQTRLDWLVGEWHSDDAVVMYPTMETIKYFEIMEFTPLSPILIDYKSQTWHAENKSKMHTEKGYLKVQPDSETIAFVVAHNFGLTEIDEGTSEGETLHLDSKFLNWISFTKLTATRKVIRDFVLKDGVLNQTVLMETIKTPLQVHLEINYRKKN